MLRARVPRFAQDRFFAPAIEAAARLIAERAFESLLTPALGLPSAGHPV